MNTLISKRTFLSYLAATPLVLSALHYISPVKFAHAAADAPKTSGPFTLPKLPYAANALEKAIDTQTMELHHGKHHQAYVDKLNDEVAKSPALKDKTLEQIIGEISKYPAPVRNNAGGHWNHTFFWNIMTSDATQPSAALKLAIESAFGSMDEFKKKFEEAGTKQFGSGWVWLIVNAGGKLEIISTPNQDNPLMDDAKIPGTPVLGNDVWEHAYYLRYFNKRADYLKSWWNVVNWNAVSEHYAKAKV